LQCIICTLPFPFENATNDTFTGPGNELFSTLLTLPQPMAYLNNNASLLKQATNGNIVLYGNNLIFKVLFGGLPFGV
jgi:hypothetical protein